jgi:hypothetical protein
MIHAFLPALLELKDPTVEEIHFSTSQPATHGFLDSVTVLLMIFQGPE